MSNRVGYGPDDWRYWNMSGYKPGRMLTIPGFEDSVVDPFYRSQSWQGMPRESAIRRIALSNYLSNGLGRGMGIGAGPGAPNPPIGHRSHGWLIPGTNGVGPGNPLNIHPSPSHPPTRQNGTGPGNPPNMRPSPSHPPTRQNGTGPGVVNPAGATGHAGPNTKGGRGTKSIYPTSRNV